MMVTKDSDVSDVSDVSGMMLPRKNKRGDLFRKKQRPVEKERRIWRLIVT